MNLMSIGAMCLDIDYDIALDEATKKLAVQHEELASRTSRAFASPMTALAAPQQPTQPAVPPRVGSYGEVDRVLDEVLGEGCNDGSFRGTSRW